VVVAVLALRRSFYRGPVAGARDEVLERAWSGLLLGTMTLFVVNIGLMVAAVATNSFARRWLGTWLPEGYTTSWYQAAWKEFQLGSVLWVTLEVVGAVVLLSILIGVPAAYVLARRDFAAKKLVVLLFFCRSSSRRSPTGFRSRP